MSTPSNNLVENAPNLYRLLIAEETMRQRTTGRVRTPREMVNALWRASVLTTQGRPDLADRFLRTLGDAE